MGSTRGRPAPGRVSRRDEARRRIRRTRRRPAQVSARARINGRREARLPPDASKSPGVDGLPGRSGGTQRWSQNTTWLSRNPCFAAVFAGSRHRGRESHSLRHFRDSVRQTTILYDFARLGQVSAGCIRTVDDAVRFASCFDRTRGLALECRLRSMPRRLRGRRQAAASLLLNPSDYRGCIFRSYVLQQALRPRDSQHRAASRRTRPSGCVG